jgi:hypothetical protein
MLGNLWTIFFENETTSSHAEPYQENVKELRNVLRLHGCSTRELILEYFQECFEMQNEIGRVESYGTLTIITDYSEEKEVLRLKILNATLPQSGVLNIRSNYVSYNF